MHTKLTLCLSLHYRFPNHEGLHNLIHGMWLAISAFLGNEIIGACAGGVQGFDYRSIEQDEQPIATQWATATCLTL